MRYIDDCSHCLSYRDLSHSAACEARTGVKCPSPSPEFAMRWANKGLSGSLIRCNNIPYITARYCPPPTYTTAILARPPTTVNAFLALARRLGPVITLGKKLGAPAANRRRWRKHDQAGWAVHGRQEPHAPGGGGGARVRGIRWGMAALPWEVTSCGG